MRKRKFLKLQAAGCLCLAVLAVILRFGLTHRDGGAERAPFRIESELQTPGEEKMTGRETDGGTADKSIRVVIMTSGYQDALHDSVSLGADGGLMLSYGDQKEEWTNGVLTLLPDDSRFGAGKVTVEPLDPSCEIRIESISRGCGIPAYGGKLEVWSSEEGMAIVNELPMESYLSKVVPSEMPSSYEEEALKVQAVCARSYAVRQMEEYAYPQYKAHVNDSTEFQVYNNSAPSDRTRQAVEQTRGEVVRYQECVAVTYYYSTSCGKTTDMGAWGNKVDDGNSYLQSVDVAGKDGDYEKALPWYHWSAEIPGEVLQKNVENYAGIAIGAVEQAEVTKRGAGGVALELTVSGTEGRVVVETENKIRTALGGSGYEITKNDGSVVGSQPLLPSAFIQIEKRGNTFHIEGGGFGHGIGMSQNGANEMAKAGKNYKEILGLFYTGTTVAKAE